MKINNQKINITIPAYNEEYILEKNFTEVFSFLNTSPYTNWEITIAENGSTDNTLKIAQKLSKKFPNTNTISCPKGRGRAIKKSWQKSDAQLLIYMDADLSTKPQKISSLVEALKKNDVAIGSRFLKNSKSKRTILRKIISLFYNFLFRFFTGMQISDTQCGFKGINKNTLKIIPLIKDNEWFFDSELIFKAKKNNLKIAEIPIKWEERNKNKRKSKVKIISDSFIFLKNLIKLKK